MAKIYKVGIVFEFDPSGEHEDLFEDMTEEEMVRDMVRMVNEDVANGHGTVSVVEVVETPDSKTCDDCGVDIDSTDRLCPECFDQWLQQASRGGR
jgi:hypothetical protein